MKGMTEDRPFWWILNPPSSNLLKSTPNQPSNNSCTSIPQLYYYSLHDYNEDHALDGHELRWGKRGKGRLVCQLFLNLIPLFSVVMDGAPSSGFSLTRLEQEIDKILEENDLNNDGVITWEE